MCANVSRTERKQTGMCKQMAYMMSVETSQIFQLVSLDFVHLKECIRDYEKTLVIMNHYTWLVQADASTS